MKYKEIFKSWWFYVLVVVYALIKVFTDTITYGKLFFVEYAGIFLGSFIGVLFLVSIVFFLIKLFKKILPKEVTKT